jgi:hypothetical protein
MSETICARAAALESALWENSLGGDDAHELQTHAATCPECSSVLDGVQLTKHGLRVFAENEGHVPDVDKAWAKVNARLVAPRFRVPVQAYAIAATLLVVLSGAWILGATRYFSASTSSARMMEVSGNEFSNTSSPLPQAKVAVDQSPASGPRHVERTAVLGLHVADARACYKRVTGLVAEAGGIIVSSRIEQSDATSPTEAVCSLKVPVARFDGFLGDLRGLGEIASEEIRGDDRTTEVHDIEARIRDKDAAIEALRNRLTRNPNADEVARIEAELARSRSERDAFESARRELAGRTDFTTIDLRLTERKLEPRGGMIYWQLFADRFGDSFGTATNLFSWGLSALVVTAGALLPWMLVIIPAWFVVKRRVYAW